MSQPSQPVLQPLQVSGTEQTQVFPGFPRHVEPQGIRPIDNVNFPHEPVTQYLGHVADTQPSLVTDNQSVNRLVYTRGNAPLPKAPFLMEQVGRGSFTSLSYGVLLMVYLREIRWEGSFYL